MRRGTTTLLGLSAIIAAVPMGMLLLALYRPADETSYELLYSSGLFAFLWALLPVFGVCHEAFRRGRRFAASEGPRRSATIAGLWRYARGRPLIFFVVFSSLGLLPFAVAHLVYGETRDLEVMPAVLAAWIALQCIVAPAAFLVGRLFPSRSVRLISSRTFGR